MSLQYAPEHLLSDRDFILQAVRRDGDAIEFASPDLKKDREIVMEAVRHGSIFTMNYVDEIFRRDMEVVRANFENSMPHADGSLTAHRELMEEAIKVSPSSLMYASEELKSDKEFVLWAMELGATLSCLSEGNPLLTDREVVLKGVKRHGEELKDLPNEMKADKEVVLCAVSNFGRALRHASEELRDDKDVVLAAVSNEPLSLEYASEHLRDDKDIILCAVGTKGREGFSSPVSFASDRLKADKEVALASVSLDGESLSFFDETIKRDKDVVMAAAFNNAVSLIYASDAVVAELGKDLVFMERAARNAPSSLKFVCIPKEVTQKLKMDREFVLGAVKANGQLFVLFKLLRGIL